MADWFWRFEFENVKKFTAGWRRILDRLPLLDRRRFRFLIAAQEDVDSGRLAGNEFVLMLIFTPMFQW